MTRKPTSPGHQQSVAPAEERRAAASQRNGAGARAEVARYISRHRLEELHRVLQLIAMAVFGVEATVVPHLRGTGAKRRLTFVVDAADPSATVRYAEFLPRERAFWAAYAAVEKPNVLFAVAIRPARGWSRTEALAPLFTALPFPEGIA